MTVSISSLTDPPLSASASDDAYELYKAALEWRLTAPIVIRSADDIISADRWRDRVEPFHHQVRNLISFCRLAPAVLIADEVGLGKTISAGLIASELIARQRVARALVICPRVLCEQWVSELQTKFRINAVSATGSELIQSVRGTVQVVVTSYETAARYLSNEAMPTDEFQMLILDEAHRLRNLYGGTSSPRMAVEIRRALEERWFTYVLMLTATPVQNRFTDIFSLVDLLTVAKGHQNPFGDFKTFRTRYLVPGTDGRRLQPQMADQFRQHLNAYVTRTRRVDADLPFPTRNVKTFRVVLSDQEKRLEEIVGGIVGTLNALEQSSLGQALMSSPAALVAQLDNMTSGRLSFSRLRATADSVRQIADGLKRPAKLERLCTLCEQLAAARSDWRVVVFTRRRQTQDLIRRVLESMKITVGLIAGGRTKDNQADLTAFTSDPPTVHALVATDAGAEGINLQAANVIVNYDLPWNPMIVEQRIGRVQRLGSAHETVEVINLVAQGTVEESVVERLLERLMTVSETVGDLESILAGVDNSSEDGASERFETVVRDMVVRSLQGQDIERAAKQRAASIDRAKQEYEENCKQLNRNLGALNAGASTSVPPPAFDATPPSIPAREFVRRSLLADGNHVSDHSPGVLCVKSVGGREHHIAVSALVEAELPDGAIPLVIPGQPQFDRMTERLTTSRRHRVVDVRSSTNELAERMARAWCANYAQAVFLGASVRTRRSYINGTVLVRTVAENRLDQYQQLVEYAVQPHNHNSIPIDMTSAGPALDRQVSLGEVSTHATGWIRRSLEEDSNLNKFVSYYTARRINDLSRTGANPHLRQRVEDDLTVSVTAEVVGFRGACYEEALVDVAFLIDGHRYEATLQGVPATGQLIEKPTDERCPVTGLTLPYGILRNCELTGRLLPHHQLVMSEVSGRHALAEFAVTCDVTGQVVLNDEVEISAVSGQRAVSSKFVTCCCTNERILQSESATSDYSGMVVRKDLLQHSVRHPYRLGVDAEFGTCHVSGRRLLLDEVGVSDISGRTVDNELLIESARSGRRGMASEAVVCQKTNRRLLVDEVGTCQVTGMTVDDALLLVSEYSGIRASEDFFVRCMVTNSLALPDELEQCHLTNVFVLPGLLTECVISGKRMLRMKMVRCSVSGAWISPQLAVKSDLSGDLIRPDLVVRSDRQPHRCGAPDEFGMCAVSNRRLLIDEMGCSSVTGRVIDRDILVEIRGHLAHPSELVKCAVTEAYLLPEQTGICQITKQLVDRELLVCCEVSKRDVLRTEASTCVVTGKTVALDQLAKCEATGLLAIESELVQCEESGLRIIPDQCVKNADTGGWLLRSNAGRSDVRPRWVSRRVLQQSQKPPGRWGTADEFSTCEVTGRQLLLDELGVSSVSGRKCDLALIVRSEVSQRAALPDELVTCEETRAWCLPCETGVCESSGARVSLDQLMRSDDSGRICLKRLFLLCPISFKRIPIDESGECALTGKRVLKALLGTCTATSVLALQSELVRCSATGDYVIPQEIGRSHYSGRVVKKSLLRNSQIPPERLGTTDEFGVCYKSRKRLLLDELWRCSVTKQLFDRRLLVKCAVTNDLMTIESTTKCAWLGKRVRNDLLGRCELTGVMVAESFLDKNGMLQPLAQLLDGKKEIGASERPGLVPILRALQIDLLDEDAIPISVNSPSGNAAAVCIAVVEKGWLFTRLRHFGFILSVSPTPQITGDMVIGTRGKKEWQLDRRIAHTAK